MFHALTMPCAPMSVMLVHARSRAARDDQAVSDYRFGKELTDARNERAEE